MTGCKSDDKVPTNETLKFFFFSGLVQAAFVTFTSISFAEAAKWTECLFIYLSQVLFTVFNGIFPMANTTSLQLKECSGLLLHVLATSLTLNRYP